MKSRCLCRVFVVLAFYGLGHLVRAEDLGFPKRCVELPNVSRDSDSYSDAYSSKDSVLFHAEAGLVKGKNGQSGSFLVWDTETGKLLARRQTPDTVPLFWSFSPDGKLLATPQFGQARPIQLWEVGAKDAQGVPQLRLITELRRREALGAEQPRFGWSSHDVCIPLGWTPDSKTLIAGYSTPGSQILFWSYTDKPSVLSDSPQNEREPKAWKPWAKLKFDARIRFAVSPDNQTLAVIEQDQRPTEGQLFDLQTAQPREKFKIDFAARPAQSSDSPDFIPTFSPDGKTLAINGENYFALWDTAPPVPRFEMVAPDFRERNQMAHSFTFTPDNRWCLTLRIVQSKDVVPRQGGLMQVRDMQTGEVIREVSFPAQLGVLHSITELPGNRAIARFYSRKGGRHFLWHTDDLLRYALEHGTSPLR